MIFKISQKCIDLLVLLYFLQRNEAVYQIIGQCQVNKLLHLLIEEISGIYWSVS